MKNVTAKITLFIAAAALCISINACKKSATDSDLSTVQDNTQAESESNFIGSSVDAAQANPSNSAPRSSANNHWIPSCATIHIDTTTTPRTLTITFNPSCTCYDGKVRSGVINVSWTGKYRDAGTVIHTWTTGYTVNGNTHNFKKWVINNGLTLYNGNMVPYFTVKDTANISFTDGTNISWISAKTRTWIQGSTAPWYEWWLTKYSIAGSASGVDRKGIPFTVTITNPIIVDLSCFYAITQGTVDVQPQGKALRELDFGSGSCDNNATITISGTTYSFHF